MVLVACNFGLSATAMFSLHCWFGFFIMVDHLSLYFSVRLTYQVLVSNFTNETYVYIQSQEKLMLTMWHECKAILGYVHTSN